MGAKLCKGRAKLYGVIGECFKLLVAILILSVPSVASAKPFVIAVLGDSLTQGYGLPQQDGLVPQLQSWLDTQGEDVRILNAGVSGDTTAGGLARIEWTLTPEVQALIVILGGNDILRGINPVESRKNIAAILEVAVGRELPVMLVGIPAPGNYGQEYKTQFDAMYPELAKEYDTLFFANFFTPILAPQPNGQGQIPAAKFMQPDGIHPNAAGVRKIVPELGPAVKLLALQAD